MSDKQSKFEAEKLSILKFGLTSENLSSPLSLNIEQIKGFKIRNRLNVRTNIKDKIINLAFDIEIVAENSDDKVEPQAKASFSFVFVFGVENIEELSSMKNDIVQLDINLASAVAGVSYSTLRGFLLSRLQNTALQNFMLPVINPLRLLQQDELPFEEK